MRLFTDIDLTTLSSITFLITQPWQPGVDLGVSLLVDYIVPFFHIASTISGGGDHVARKTD